MLTQAAFRREDRPHFLRVERKTRSEDGKVAGGGEMGLVCDRLVVVIISRCNTLGDRNRIIAVLQRRVLVGQEDDLVLGWRWHGIHSHQILAETCGADTVNW